MHQRQKKVAAGVVLCILGMLIHAVVCARGEPYNEQDLPATVARLEQELRCALREGDLEHATQLLPQAERLEKQLLGILEDPRSTSLDREKLVSLLEIVGGLRHEGSRFIAKRNWRVQAQPRIVEIGM